MTHVLERLHFRESMDSALRFDSSFYKREDGFIRNHLLQEACVSGEPASRKGLCISKIITRVGIDDQIPEGLLANRRPPKG